MGAKTIIHNKHEHVIRTINEELLGIKIDDRDTEKISEAFGWNDKVFEKCFLMMEKYFIFQNAAEELDEELPRNTKISKLVDFLKSNTFKNLGIKISEPNDYFMLGFIYCAAITKTELEGVIDVMAGNRADPKKLLEILKQFRAAIEER